MKIKGSGFAKSYASYLYGIREIFGNKALLVLVGDREKTYEELSNDIFTEKTLIRQKYVNNNVGIITNLEDEQVNYVRYVDKRGKLKEPRILNGIGNIRINDMNIIHSPDPDEATTKLYGIREIFGNKALLVLVGDREKTYEELSNDIFTEKTLIRQKYVNNNVGIITNLEDEQVNYVRYVDKRGKLKEPRILNGIGNIRINDMNIIHSPDPDEATTKEELQIIINSGILQDKNLLTPDTIKKIREYGTFNFFNDMKKDDYQGNIGPDISGFIKSEIDER